MAVHIEDNKLVIITEPNTIHFDLHENVQKNLKYQIDSITKHNEFLAEHAIKNEISEQTC